MRELENYMRHYALLTAKQSALPNTKQPNHHVGQLLEAPFNVLEITSGECKEGHELEERLPGTKKHFSDLKFLAIEIYKDSKYPKPVAIVQAVLSVLCYDGAITFLKTHDSLLNTKDWLEEDPDEKNF